MTDNPEPEELGPLPNASENTPEQAVEQPAEFEVDEDQSFTTEYWTQGIKPILGVAATRAQKLIAEATLEKPAPSWAVRVYKKYPDMLAESNRHQNELVDGAEAILERGEPIQGQRSLAGSIERWYRGLGPTNNTPDNNPTLLRMVDVLETQESTPKTGLLAGNLL